MNAPEHTNTRRDARRLLLWLALIASAAANAVTSSMDIHPAFGIGIGLTTLACAVALIRDHYHRRGNAAHRHPAMSVTARDEPRSLS
ncbi:hypothetical protein [Micromonospora inyonensis]|uniref:Uncharacterized protein n=1 Tax=Micromonospora inyonensis TaxID=47866 RepID=A0A1C6SC75_9ACTN|nr:hypothetical protein [Micromonospora inyonensis]SCL27089.1 hypothetical protein GA0074694_4706 [Micromonospora inyonensis]